ncbi:MAG: gliding motility-associated ABC transporter ATP-binding subunit GldA [Flavobacteriales bacterium]|nr:gliding motility-associated ABC transporter ATP-binding subunit GldA [Flavobacteriales bacterium]
MSIKVEGVSKFYGEQKALDNVSFSVGAKEVVGFLGPNGAGKSTMMKIITCFIPPSEGRVEVCGFDTDKQSLEVRRQVGYLPESNPLYHEMYVKEYLGFVAGLYGIPDPKKRIAEMIEATGLGVEQHKKIGQLSKGYKQRVGLAQAMLNDPKVLILDEPTSGLDPNQLIGIRQLIKQLGKEKTVLFSSHIMQEVEAICDRVIIIDRGRIVTDRKASEVSDALGGQTVIVEFSAEVGISALRAIATVKHADRVQGLTYTVSGSGSEDLRMLVAQWAQQHGHLILSMNVEEERLEAVFQRLTATDR